MWEEKLHQNLADVWPSSCSGNKKLSYFWRFSHHSEKGKCINWLFSPQNVLSDILYSDYWLAPPPSTKAATSSFWQLSTNVKENQNTLSWIFDHLGLFFFASKLRELEKVSCPFITDKLARWRSLTRKAVFTAMAIPGSHLLGGNGEFERKIEEFERK